MHGELFRTLRNGGLFRPSSCMVFRHFIQCQLVYLQWIFAVALMGAGEELFSLMATLYPD